MAKVLTERNIDTISCPGCKANIEIERENPTHRIIDKSNDETTERLNKIEAMLTKEVEKPAEKPKKEEVLPSFIPGYVCKGCNDVHRNKGYKRKAKHKCNNCDQFSDSDKAKCPWCGEKDYRELDEDELLMLPEPAEVEHEHE